MPRILRGICRARRDTRGSAALTIRMMWCFGGFASCLAATADETVIGQGCRGGRARVFVWLHGIHAVCTRTRNHARAQGPLQDLFLARRKGDVNFADFINVVGPVYLEFAALAHTEHHKNTRFHKPKHPWRMGQQ